MIETWKPIDGWPYEVSNLGRVRNARNGFVLKPIAHKSGYLNVQLWNRGDLRCAMVHRLVAIAFIGQPPTDQHEVAHRDGNRHHNTEGNLRWVLHVENMEDRDRHGTTARGIRNGKLKHSDELVAEVHRLKSVGLGNRRISKATGIPRATVMGYLNGTRRQGAERGTT